MLLGSPWTSMLHDPQVYVDISLMPSYTFRNSENGCLRDKIEKVNFVGFNDINFHKNQCEYQGSNRLKTTTQKVISEYNAYTHG